VRHVADLARRVREGEPLAEDLVTAARELQRWYDDPAGGCCPEPCELWLSWGKGSMTTEPTAVADLMSTVMRRVRRNGTGFLAATAPQIRTIFDVSPRTPLADRLGGHNLATLPRELPTTTRHRSCSTTPALPLHHCSAPSAGTKTPRTPSRTWSTESCTSTNTRGNTDTTPGYSSSSGSSGASGSRSGRR
jgi:hypothetical protein